MAKNIDVDAAMQVWQQVDFSNRFMFRLVMENPELCKQTLEVVLGMNITKLEYLEPEKSFEAQLRSKGVRLDVYIEDADGVAYDLEMQATDADGIALGKRTRYYQSLMDQNLLKKGKFYVELPKSVVVFICKYDPFAKGLLKYTFRNVCTEDNNVELNDEASKIIINTFGNREKASQELLNFIDFVNSGRPSDDFTNKLAEAVQKEQQDGKKAVLYMTWEQTLLEENYKGEMKGRAEGKAEDVRNLMDTMGLPAEEAMQALKVPKEEQAALLAQL